MNHEVFAREIALIFNSENSLRFKYDNTVKLICKSFEASMVSIMLYDSTEDSLVCRGSYIDPNQIQFTNPKNGFKRVLENLNVFYFLKQNNLRDGVLNYEKLFEIYLNSISKPDDINLNSFVEICKSFKKYESIYKSYLKVFEEDKHRISDETITGLYYKSLLENESFKENYKIYPLNNYSDLQLNCIKLLENKLEISIDDRSFYIGLPINATNRNFGVLRIIYKNKYGIIKSQNNMLVLNKEYEERLAYFAQLVSLHIETNYYLHGYKQLAYLNETIPDKKPLELKKACEQLARVVNCHGAMIRLFNDKKNDSIIADYSSSLENYTKFINDFKDVNNPEKTAFNKNIVSLLENNPNMIAISFSVKSFSSNTISYFVLDDDKHIKRQDLEFTLNDKTMYGYEKKLVELNLCNFVIVPIPYLNKGFLVLFNTKNRNFIMADVEMQILAASEIGLEIKRIENSEKLKKIENKKIQIENMRELVHQVGAPLNLILSHVENIVEDRVVESLKKERLTYVYQMLKNTKSRLKSFQRILDLESNNNVYQLKKSKIYIKKYLIEKSIEFQTIAKEKGIKIHVIGPMQYDDQIVNIDKQLFDEIFYCLIDNAVKYSYDIIDLKRLGITYEENNLVSKGNILINYEIKDNVLITNISNWGLEILDNEKDKIFDRNFRSESAKDYSPPGSGIGLYLVKKISEVLKGTIEVNSSENKTTFTLNFKI